MKYTLNTTKLSYAAAWKNMVIKPHILPQAQKAAQKIIDLRPKYEPLEKATGVPWYFIGLLHMRESNFNFETHLHNGDPLNVNGKAKRTTHVPAGRPAAPPENGKTYTFHESALDALTYEFGKVKDWSIEQIAYLQELYNGFGYRQRGLPSPYLWSGSNQYSRGKYIRDGVFDPSVVDVQLGVMVVLRCVLDATQPVPDIVSEAVVEKVVQELEQPAVPLSPAADVKKPATKELRKVSRKFRLTEWLRSFFGWTTGVTTAGATLSASNITATKSFLDTVVAFGADYGIFILIAVLVGGFIATHFLMEWMKEDVAEGRNTPSGEV